MPFRKTRRNKQKAGAGQLERFQYLADFTTDIDTNVLQRERLEIINSITRLTEILGIIDAHLNTHPTSSAPLLSPSPTQPLFGDEALAAAMAHSDEEELNAQMQMMAAYEAERRATDIANDAEIAAALASDDNQQLNEMSPPSHSLERARDLVNAAQRLEDDDTSSRTFMWEPEYEAQMNRSRFIRGGRKRKHTRNKRQKTKKRSRRRTQSK